MVVRLWHALAGYLRVRVRGPVPERLVNLCVQEGIPLWDVRAADGGILVSVGLRDFRRLRPLRRRAGVGLRIAGRHGLPFALRRLRRVQGAVGLLLLAVLLLYLLSQFVWFVEVRGTRTLDPAEVLRAAAELGLRPGVWRGVLDPDRFTRDLVLRLPALSWATLRFFGAKATLEVAEKVLPPPLPGQAPGDIVARRGGVVVQVVVVDGEAAVQPGQAVRPGDVLIRGLRRAADGGPAGEPVPVRARGRVVARTWYTAYAEEERVERVRVPTGRRARQWLLRAGGRSLRVWGASRPPFSSFDQSERVVARFPWPTAGHAAEIVEVRYDEVTVHAKPLSREEAIRRAEARLRAHLLAQIGLDARIVDVYSRVVQETPQVVGLRLTVECLENIGQWRLADGEPGAEPEPLPGP